MADEGAVATFEYTVGGRLLTFKKITIPQITMLKRYVESLKLKSAAAIEAEDITTVMALTRKMNEATWTTVESQFTSPEDLEWVQLEIIAGRLQEEDLMPLLSNGTLQTAPPDDDADPTPAKRPGRKAPAKKAAPAKKTANPSRAKR